MASPARSPLSSWPSLPSSASTNFLPTISPLVYRDRFSLALSVQKKFV
jgi:hypothetical protein